MNPFLDQSSGAAGAPTKRRLAVLTCGALALAAAVSVGTWRTFDRGERDTASPAPASAVAVGAPAQNLAPLHSTTADSGRLTVYLSGSPPIVPAMAPTAEGVPQPAYADWQINEMTARHPEP